MIDSYESRIKMMKAEKMKIATSLVKIADSILESDKAGR
mgnify:CR=1 FL=1